MKIRISGQSYHLFPLLLASISLLSIPAFSLYSWKWADDFEMSNLINQYDGIFNYLITRYLTWDGRFASLNALVQTILMHYAGAKLSVFVWGISFIASSYYVYKLLYAKYRQQIVLKLNVFLGVSLIAATLWLGMFYVLAQVIYWQTGGVYSFALLTGLVWIYFHSTLNQNSRTLPKILFFILSIFAGTASHNLTIALMACFTIDMFTHYWTKNANKSLYTGFIGLMLGAFIVFLSPGNYKRLGLYSNTMSFGITDIANNLLFLLGRYFYFSMPVLAFAVLGGIALFYLLNNEYKSEKWDFIWYLNRFRWLIVALSTLVIFLAAPFLAEPRTSVFFMAFLYLFVADNTLYFFPKIKSKWLVIQRIKSHWVLFAVFSIHLAIAGHQFYKATRVNPKFAQRFEQLELARNTNTDLEISPINPSHVPFILQFNDINENKDFWVNQQMAKFYGLHSVKLTYTIQKK